MSPVVTVDTSVLNEKVSLLLGALLGRGGSPGDIQRALATEAGLCAWRIADALGPASKAEATAKVEKDMLGSFRTGPEINLTEEQQYSSTADFTWLQAGPVSLVGINDEDNLTSAGVDEALAIYNNARQTKSARGNAWVRLGTRGKQAVMRLNRVRLSKTTFNGVRRAIASRIGQSRAAWARTAAELSSSKPIPAWIRAQIGSVIENGKAILEAGRLWQPIDPFVIFGSRAKGVETNPVVVAKIRAGIKTSEVFLMAKFNKVLAGQTYNWNTGQVFPPTKFDDK